MRNLEMEKMAEYIERAALLKKLITCGAICEFGECLIKRFPTADVAPVVHGRWDDSGRYTFPGGGTAVRCTECGCALTVSEYHLNNWNYCPVCWAKMDGGADHE